MNTVRNIRELGKDIRGLSTVEYVLLLVLIAAGSIKAWEEFGAAVVTKVDGSKEKISDLKL